MDLEYERLIGAIEKVRRDKHEPGRYLLFTFFNGIAYGLGVTLGMTIVLGLVIFIITKLLASMIDFPVIGYYVGELMQVIDTYIKQGAKLR